MIRIANDGRYMIVIDPILVMDSHEPRMNVSKDLERDTWHVYGLFPEWR